MEWYQYPILKSNDYATVYNKSIPDTPHFASDVQTGEAGHPIPVTALLGGKVKQAGCRPWGGEVFVETISPYDYHPLDWYVYHLSEVNVKPGDAVRPGDKIGLSGGDQSGKCPTQPRFSSGPHTHTGFFDYNFSGKTPSPGNYPVSHGIAHTPRGDINFGPNMHPFIDTVVFGGTRTDPNILPSVSGLFDPGKWYTSILKSLGLTDTKDLLYRVGFIGIGTIFIIVGIVMLAKSVSNQATGAMVQAVT